MSASRRDWFKSSRSSSNANCVEVRLGGDAVGVRDSKDPSGPTLAFVAASWASFTLAIKLGGPRL
ncbi:DUF397 domain-containing protein [Micromonospora sp. WMMD712]|uniref:DUF397 domain-containing protein n=1 Tax=Micromonospora sp. WMMD712 TaxID=3016096 RepID=UPI00249CCB34|nr:DUF397 domain-containing protein [Micromonospora sp. WMMD712]WFE55462.1 DUF397 domain-containing protein [Micromonospora sp. WMMD712]